MWCSKSELCKQTTWKRGTPLFLFFLQTLKGTNQPNTPLNNSFSHIVPACYCIVALLPTLWKAQCGCSLLASQQINEAISHQVSHPAWWSIKCVNAVLHKKKRGPSHTGQDTCQQPCGNHWPRGKNVHSPTSWQVVTVRSWVYSAEVCSAVYLQTLQTVKSVTNCLPSK